MERVTCFKYLGVNLTDDLSWSNQTDALVKKSRQRLYHLRRLRTFGVSPRALQNFYTCTIESILTGSITTWYGNCTVQEQKALQRVVKTAGRITGGALPSIQDIYTRRCRSKSKRILEDNSHPAHGLFVLLKSGKRYRIHKTGLERFRKSFYPHAIRILNDDMDADRRQGLGSPTRLGMRMVRVEGACARAHARTLGRTRHAHTCASVCAHAHARPYAYTHTRTEPSTT